MQTYLPANENYTATSYALSVEPKGASSTAADYIAWMAGARITG